MSRYSTYIAINKHVYKGSRRRLQNFLITLYDLWAGGGV